MKRQSHIVKVRVAAVSKVTGARCPYCVIELPHGMEVTERNKAAIKEASENHRFKDSDRYKFEIV